MSRRGFTMAPPSPVPTGKGLRSSAINDDILSDFLTSSLQIPDLKLPVSFQSRHLHIPPVDYRLVLSGDCDAIESAKRSASEFGFFAFGGHGATATDVEAVDGEEDEGFDFCWAGEEGDDEGSELNPDIHSDPSLRNWERKEAELIAIGKPLGKIFYKGACGFGSVQAKASSSIVILKCNVDYELSSGEAFLSDQDNGNGRCCDSESAFCLYLTSSKCEVMVQVGTESFVFEAGPDTVVAILGQQFEVGGNVKKLPRKLRFVLPVDAQNNGSHPLILSIGLKLDRIVAVSDQIMAATLIILLFQLALWIYKSVQRL